MLWSSRTRTRLHLSSRHIVSNIYLAFTKNDDSPSACCTPCWSTTLNKICTYCFERALYWCRFPSPEYSLPHMCNSQNPPALHCRSELWSFSFKKKTHRKESRIPLYTWKRENLSRKKLQYKLSSINRDGREPCDTLRIPVFGFVIRELHTGVAQPQVVLSFFFSFLFFVKTWAMNQWG